MQDWNTDVYDKDARSADAIMQDIEKMLDTLQSSFSGGAAPSNPVAGMWWFDTAANLLKLRNEANNAWLNVWDLANNKPIITNLSNEITGGMISSTVKDPAAATAGLRTIGTGSLQACAGNDSRLNNQRVPIDASVSIAKLKTSQQSQAYNIPALSTHEFTLTGGEYCFYPTFSSELGHCNGGYEFTVPAEYTTKMAMRNRVDYYRYGYIRHRYVTSSGEVMWIFFLREKETRKIVGASVAPDHPCFGNGGNPLLIAHPFGNYDAKKYEIIVVNPSLAEIDEMESATIVEDQTKPDRDILNVIMEDYEIDESSHPKWPNTPVTVGLPKHIIKDGKKILADYRFMSKDTIVEPIKKKIPKPNYIKVKKLCLKK